MDIFLQKKYSYTVTNSFEEAKTKLQGILNNKWYDLSEKYYGSVTDEGVFSFKEKIIFISLGSFGRLVYLDGNLVKKDNNTTIYIKVAPNPVFVFIIYLLPLISLNALFGDNSLMGQNNSRISNFCVLFSMELILFTIVQIACFFLRRKFEKVMIETSQKETPGN